MGWRIVEKKKRKMMMMMKKKKVVVVLMFSVGDSALGEKVHVPAQF